MSKIEIFLPLPSMTAAMNAHFSAGNVIRPFGLPTGPELPADDLTEQELLEIGLEAAEEKVLELNRSSSELHTVVADAPFIGKFTDADGTLIGWEFEFMVFSQPWK